MGVARFRLVSEMDYATPYRVADRRLRALSPRTSRKGAGEAAVDREGLLATLRRFAEVNEIKVVWSDIKKASNEALVNGLSMMSPCGPREKQALLEAARPEGARRNAGRDHDHRPRTRRRRGNAAALSIARYSRAGKPLLLPRGNW